MSKQPFPVGVLISSANLDTDLAHAAGVGAEVVQIWCTSGELAPVNADAAKLARVQKRCDMLGLEITALCGDLGLGFCNPDKVDYAVRMTGMFFEVAKNLGVPIVTSHIGHFADETTRNTGLTALKRLGDEGARLGVTFASETGSEDAAPLRAFLDDLKHPNIKLNFDPANMTMRGWDVANCVKLLAKDFAHTHAKDATFKGGEQSLGAGDINWPQYMSQLKKGGYTGPLVIEREGGNAFWGDVAQGLTLLRKWREAV
jgi:L-ribulose-5-phosphate 3-epimerase